MKAIYLSVSYLLLSLLFVSCGNDKDAEKESLLKAIDAYETAWANGDFLTVESFFTEDAKRLHTEPHVWDRAEIKRYFEGRAAEQKNAIIKKPIEKSDWKKGREYVEIRVEGNLGYDIFTTDRFKAVHIWEKQKDGAWKMKYDIAMLNYIKEMPMPE